jgi:hypothetical protein
MSTNAVLPTTHVNAYFDEGAHFQMPFSDVEPHMTANKHDQAVIWRLDQEESEGVAVTRDGILWEVTPPEFDVGMEVSLTGALNTAREILSV